MAPDKVAHFLTGSALFAFGYPFGIEAALSLCILVALGKEILDRYNEGTPEVLDAVTTILGGFSLWGWYLFINSWR